jgi:transcriptional regulator with XRE-family HTH domain
MLRLAWFLAGSAQCPTVMKSKPTPSAKADYRGTSMVGLIDRSRGADAREETLRRFVRERRLRLTPELRFLGESPRLPNRIGKRVTQEELAEHLGISRNWYLRFEGGAPARFSTQLLSRLGDVLLLSLPERADLMRLAMPELAPVVSANSSALYEALRDLRRTVKRLWSASSEAEIFQFAGEEARRVLPDSELIWVQRGLRVARDDALPFQHPEGNAAARLHEARADLLRRFTPEQLARVDALVEGTAAGDTQAFEAYPRDIARVIGLVLREHGIAVDSVIAAHIRGPKSVLVGGLSTRPHEVTELQRAVLSAIADFASLALR